MHGMSLPVCCIRMTLYQGFVLSRAIRAVSREVSSQTKLRTPREKACLWEGSLVGL